MPTQQTEIQQNENHTVQYREFGGVNLTDTRTSIDDKEFAFLENAIPVGKGNLRLVPGVGATISGGALPASIASVFGFVLKGNPILMCVGTDGSIAQVNVNTGAITAVAVAVSVSTACRMTPFSDSPILIIDPTKGYSTWDGTTWNLVSGSRTGSSIAVFEGRVWFVNPLPSRTITFSAPNSFTDFTAGSGGGSVTVTDSAFPGSVTALISALEQLWIVGPGAVDAITNVQTIGSPIVTTFSLTNIVSNVGTTRSRSVSSFFRTLLFLTEYGVYAIVGATPQKLSDKLDGLFPNLTLDPDSPAAVGTVHNVFIWCVLTQFNDPTKGPRKLLLCFSQGKWFFASAGSIVSLTSVVVGSQPQIWATTGVGVFPLFNSLTTPVTYKIQSKLFDFGDSTQMKELNHFGLEIQSNNIVSPTLTIDNENLSTLISITAKLNTLTFVGSGPITFVGTGPITWVVAGLQLFRTAQVPMFGDYIGYTITGTESVWTLSCAAMDIRPGGKWQTLQVT